MATSCAGLAWHHVTCDGRVRHACFADGTDRVGGVGVRTLSMNAEAVRTLFTTFTGSRIDSRLAFGCFRNCRVHRYPSWCEGCRRFLCFGGHGILQLKKNDKFLIIMLGVRV